MSVSAQDAIAVIQPMTSMFTFEHDFLTIVAAEEAWVKSNAERKKERDELTEALMTRKKAMEAARVSATRPANVLSAEDHSKRLHALENEHFNCAKAIGNIEAKIGASEAELAELKDEARRLKEYDPAAEHERELDGATLRLQIYRGLGFDPILDKSGQVTKVLVRGTNDVYPVDFNTTKSEFEITQELWKLASS